MLSLARGLSVLRAFGAGPAQMSVGEASRRTGLSRAAVRRCLHTLCVLGYATNQEGAYSLTPAVLSLGQAYLGSATVTRVAQPVLERVSEQLHESCSLAVLDGADIVYLARASTRRIMSIGLSVGSRLPAVYTSMGRVLVAALPEARRTRYVATLPLVRHTPKTIVDRRAFRAELLRVQAQGFAVVDEELELGLRSIAVPVVRADGTVLAAINVGAHAARLDVRALKRDILPVLQSAAAEIARHL
jgi:IclR family pca regulon transcriptional regulator